MTCITLCDMAAKEDKKLYTFRIDPLVLQALQTITERDGIPVSEQIRRAIRAWLDAKSAGVGSGSKATKGRKR